MEPAQSAAGGGGPAPFLLKTYEMVDDSSTDDIVSWTPTNSSFVVWNPPEFAARLLPTYFKHNNFSSFIRQLNTYGFKKIDAERWEFANEEFIKGKKHLLKNIHRRKPIHSHSHSHAAGGGLSDAERALLEDEIERLNRDKATLQADLWRFKQQQSGTAVQLDDLERRLTDMEQRQHKMMAFLQGAIQNPKFLDTLRRMAGARDAGLVGTHKKRRLPGVDYCLDAGQAFNRDFCDKLTLELCPALSASNLASTSTQSSNEVTGSPKIEHNDRLECLSFVPDMLEPSDTGKDLLFPRTMDDGDQIISCHLDLTLASSLMHRGHPPYMNADSVDRVVEGAEQRAANSDGEDDICGMVQKNQGISANPSAANTQAVKPESQAGIQAPPPPPPPGRVNDMFWEQFLTERPGSSDTEEASSSLRVNPCDGQSEEKNLGDDSSWRNRKDMEQLTL